MQGRPVRCRPRTVPAASCPLLIPALRWSSCLLGGQYHRAGHANLPAVGAYNLRAQLLLEALSDGARIPLRRPTLPYTAALEAASLTPDLNRPPVAIFVRSSSA